MKRLLNFFVASIFLVCISVCVNSQTADSWTAETAQAWFAKGDYLNGLLLKPHESTNKIRFAEEYSKNKELWDKAFAFLKNTNLDTIRVGKYPIDGNNVFASVTENPTKDFENTKFEFHQKFIDIQYVIKGKEKMGVLPIEKLTITIPYDEKKDVGLGTATTDDSYYLAEPGTFFLFFPADAHRPSIKEVGCDKNKKIVVKVRVAGKMHLKN